MKDILDTLRGTARRRQARRPGRKAHRSAKHAAARLTGGSASSFGLDKGVRGIRPGSSSTVSSVEFGME